MNTCCFPRTIDLSVWIYKRIAFSWGKLGKKQTCLWVFQQESDGKFKATQVGATMLHYCTFSMTISWWKQASLLDPLESCILRNATTFATSRQHFIADLRLWMWRQIFLLSSFRSVVCFISHPEADLGRSWEESGGKLCPDFSKVVSGIDLTFSSIPL